MTFKEWLASTSYNGARKEKLSRIEEDQRGHVDLIRCQRVDCFTKLEAYTEFKEARMIMSRIDDFKVFAGRVVKSIENVVYKLPPFVKHLTMQERAKKIAEFRNLGHNYLTDYTSYEAHFDKVRKDSIDFQLYRFFLKKFPEVLKTMITVLGGKNRASTRCGVACQWIARRCSGEVDTSLCNGFANLMATLFLIWHKSGCDVLDIFDHYEGAVEGDDGAFSTDVVLTSDDYAALGFKIKLIEVDDLKEASFCGLIFNEDLQPIRDPIKFVMTFGWSHSFFGCTNRTKDQLQRAKALSALYETPHCPIIAPIAAETLQLTRGVKPRWEDVYKKPPDEFNIPTYAPTLGTRLLFERRFGITVKSQIIAEHLIKNHLWYDLSILLQPTSLNIFYWNEYVVNEST
jgi:hypothetical protein